MAILQIRDEFFSSGGLTSTNIGEDCNSYKNKIGR